MKKKKIVIFASGGGSNAQAILDYFDGHSQVEVSHFFVNNPKAYVIERAKKHTIPCTIFSKEEFLNGSLLSVLEEINPDLIVLAGFLWLMPHAIVDAFPGKIINIHPALLPKYGGKGMYGMYVHSAVKEANEQQSGITIHYVNAHYDEGGVIFQAFCDITDCTTPEEVAAKVLALEHKYFPPTIEKVLQ